MSRGADAQTLQHLLNLADRGLFRENLRLYPVDDGGVARTAVRAQYARGELTLEPRGVEIVATVNQSESRFAVIRLAGWTADDGSRIVRAAIELLAEPV